MSLAQAFWSAPPISRTITAATILISWPGHLGVFSLMRFIFATDYVFTIRQFPEVWRLLTCFFITGPQLSLIFQPFMLYSYSSQLETGSWRFRRPGSFFIYLVFTAVFLLLTGGIYLRGFVLLRPLTMAITYIYAQEDPNRQVTLIILPMPAKYLPYASLVLTLVLEGPGNVLLEFTGILAGHAFDFLDRIWPQYGGGSQLLTTPEVVEKYFSSLGVQGAHPTGEMPGTGPPQREPGRGSTSGFSRGSFGAGRRLGGS